MTNAEKKELAKRFTAAWFELHEIWALFNRKEDTGACFDVAALQVALCNLSARFGSEVNLYATLH